ncbi:MAG: carboxylesterase/lipase family protein [Herbiconiux sp.]|uniref:carboxylesterase/lipase family protein n=1 Tax=Herbiconiux sp. TaxID=1871186 RepID=UPI0011FB56A8|nr:carboxylesterase/lipase family protein [Herbiconiux sp.]TAJ49846.1 MAG: carboxylesterase/lipase family protein [Herbiconiux sp.]
MTELAPAAPEDRLVVRTSAGLIQGGEKDGALFWKGVRYAEAPTGPLRWRAPVPVAPWSGVADATSFGPAAPQISNPAIPLGPDVVKDEDCLSLNIWRATSSNRPLPVMVWIHGGAYTFGSSCQPLFDATSFVSTGEVVVVSLNYRIGAFGFLDLTSVATKEHPFDSNLALRDVLLALQWVQENIAAFGGDPERVTVFGESAGGGLVTTLLTVPSAEGLFHRAIAESSPVSSVYDAVRSASVAKRMLDQLGLGQGDVGRLRDIPAVDIVAAGMAVYAAVPSEEPGTLAFAPVVDGTLVPEHPIAVLSEGRALPVPLLIGTNRDEAALFKFMKSPLMPITEQSITAMLTEIARESPSIEMPSRDEILAAYAGLRTHAIGLGIARDVGFRMPTLWAAEGHAGVAPVWLYRFDQATPMLKLVGIGATHATELPYVWGNLDTDPKDITFKLGGKKTGRAVAERLQARWRAFATAGAPHGGDGDVVWEPFVPSGARSTLVIDRHDELVSDLDGDLRAAWGDAVLTFS